MARKVRKQKVCQYTAIFAPAEEGGYTVTVPALPGCISEGDTFEEAFKNIKEAAELYIEVMRYKNKDIPLEEELAIIAPIKVKVSV